MQPVDGRRTQVAVSVSLLVVVENPRCDYRKLEEKGFGGLQQATLALRGMYS
jgi:hypothetical protein